MAIGILALQGAFIEHEQMLQRLGKSYFEIRSADDLTSSMDALILPGGESTVMGKLLHELNLFEPLRSRICEGMPVLATCAGLILLAQQLQDDNTVWFGTMPLEVKRNAYGRQLGSFKTSGEFSGIGTVPMIFIRAPIITCVYGNTKVLATVDGQIVAAQYKNQLALSFHPELDDDLRIHEMFLKLS